MQTSSGSVEEITTGLAKFNFTHGDLDAYLRAFNEIVHCASRVRGKPIDPDELKVTKQLAGPFTNGGLLILLERPLCTHPWKGGMVMVVDECPTLAALREALAILGLGLEDSVSVLDVRPFLPKKSEPSRANTLDELNELTCQAIRAKRPDVVLCMGEVKAIS